jgi:hypothetical protein
MNVVANKNNPTVDIDTESKTSFFLIVSFPPKTGPLF